MRLEDIKKYVEERTGIEDISSRVRTIDYTMARAVYFKLAKERCTSSITSIGKAVKRHHASVLHNINNVFPDLEKHYPLYYDIYEDFDNYKERKIFAETFGVSYKLSKIVDVFHKLDTEKQDAFVLRAETMLNMIKNQ